MTSAKLTVRHISEGVKVTKEYIEDRRVGRVTSLKTSKPKLNRALMNGLDWGRILTIAGLSGAGKSIIVEEIKRDFIKLNPTQEFDILSFEFEMLIEDQLARRVSAATGATIKDIYSAFTPLDEAAKGQIEEILDEVSSDPIYYVDEVGSVDEIASTIQHFAINHSLVKNRGLVVTVDHVLLTKGKQGEKEKEIVDDLMHTLSRLKKSLFSLGVKISFIILSQLNRDIETPDRILRPILHFPTRNDIFGASSVYQCSDYLLITHRPAVLNGIKAYGPPTKEHPKGLPIKHEGRDLIYFHIIKERFGVLSVLSMIEDFAHAKVDEFDLDSQNSV